MRQKGFVLLPIIIIVVLLGAVGYVVYSNTPVQKSAKNLASPSTVTTSNLTDLSQTPDPAWNWNTYTSTGKYKYQVEVKGTPVEDKTINSIAFAEGLDDISINCPRGSGKYLSTLPDRNESTPNEGGFEAIYYKQLTINGMKAVQFIWSTSGETGGFLYTDLLRNGDPLACEIETYIRYETSNDHYQEIIDQQTDYNRVVNSFKFIQ